MLTAKQLAAALRHGAITDAELVSARRLVWEIGYQQGIADEKARKVEMTDHELIAAFDTHKVPELENVSCGYDLALARAAIAAYEAKRRGGP